MEILKVNAIIGEKYFIEWHGALRQCVFHGTRGKNCKAYYMLDIAGIGEKEIPFNRIGEFNNWYYGSKCNSILYESIENYKIHQPITAMYGADDNCYNSSFMSLYFPNLNICQCGGAVTAWAFDGVKPVKVYVSLNTEWNYTETFHYKIDDILCFQIDNFKNKMDASKVYKTAKECEIANQITIVAFD